MGLDASSTQLRQQDSPGALGPVRVQENPAINAALHGPLQGGYYRRGRGVVGKDVEQEVNVIGRGIDVGDQAVDDAVVIGQNLDRVPAENLEVTEAGRQTDSGLKVGIELRMQDLRVQFQPL